MFEKTIDYSIHSLRKVSARWHRPTDVAIKITLIWSPSAPKCSVHLAKHPCSCLLHKMKINFVDTILPGLLGSVTGLWSLLLGWSQLLQHVFTLKLALQWRGNPCVKKNTTNIDLNAGNKISVNTKLHILILTNKKFYLWDSGGKASETESTCH